MTVAKKNATALSEAEEAQLVEARKAGLDEPDSELGPGWGEEIVRRIHAVESGESRLVEGAEVAARVRKALRMI